MATTVDMSEDIRRILEMTKGKTQEKKLACIQHYLRINHGLNWALNDIDTLENQLRVTDLDPEIITEIYELLDQSFAQGYPYFIYEFSILNNHTEQQLKTSIETNLVLNLKLAPIQNSFTYLKRISDVEYATGDFLKFSLMYEHNEEVPIVGGGKREGDLQERASFEVYFDFRVNLCYFKCGDKKHLIFTQKYLSRTITMLSLVAYTLHSKIKTTPFEGDIQFHKHTIIIFDFLEVQMEHNNFNINDYLGITFGNTKSDKVRAVKLSGNNLFESYEVAERMKFQDRIKSIKFQLAKQVTTNANTMAVLSTVRVDFPSTLKVVFSTMSNNTYQRDFIHHIVLQLNTSLTKTHYSSEIDERIKELVRIAEAKDSMLVQRILNEFKEKVTEHLKDDDAKDIVFRILGEYMPER